MAKKRITVDIKKYVASLIGENAEEAFEFLYRAMRAEVECPIYDRNGNMHMGPPTMDQRITAARMLIEYQHGKPTTRAENTQVVSHQVDLSKLSDAELLTLERTVSRAELVEGEVVKGSGG